LESLGGPASSGGGAARHEVPESRRATKLRSSEKPRIRRDPGCGRQTGGSGDRRRPLSPRCHRLSTDL